MTGSHLTLTVNGSRASGASANTLPATLNTDTSGANGKSSTAPGIDRHQSRSSAGDTRASVPRVAGDERGRGPALATVARAAGDRAHPRRPGARLAERPGHLRRLLRHVDPGARATLRRGGPDL